MRLRPANREDIPRLTEVVHAAYGHTEAAIRAARDELVPVSYPSLRAEAAALQKTAANS
jgi:hypothetical protein